MDKKSINEYFTPLLIFVAFLTVTFLLVTLATIAVKFPIIIEVVFARGSKPPSWADIAAIFTTLVTSFVATLMIFTVVYQKKELGLIKNELSAHSRQFSKQNLDNILFKLIERHSGNFRNINKASSPVYIDGKELLIEGTGKEFFRKFYLEFSCMVNELDSQDEIKKIYEKYQSCYSHELGYYFRNIYNMLSIVDEHFNRNVREILGSEIGILNQKSVEILVSRQGEPGFDCDYVCYLMNTNGAEPFTLVSGTDPFINLFKNNSLIKLLSGKKRKDKAKLLRENELERRRYASIIRALFSRYDLLVMFYNCLYIRNDNQENHNKLKLYIEKYRVFKILTKKDLKIIEDLSGSAEAGIISNSHMRFYSVNAYRKKDVEGCYEDILAKHLGKDIDNHADKKIFSAECKGRLKDEYGIDFSFLDVYK